MSKAAGIPSLPAALWRDWTNGEATASSPTRPAGAGDTIHNARSAA
jgi:hypothetical protein